MKLAVLTGGGDCPGLNAVLRSILLESAQYRDELWGLCHGFEGLIREDFVLLSARDSTITPPAVFDKKNRLEETPQPFLPLFSQTIQRSIATPELLLRLGGTLLGGGKRNPLKIAGGIEQAIACFHRYEFDALLVIGGEGTFQIAESFSKRGIPIIGIPKTIDNDVWGTDFTIGFQTAVQTVTDALDRLRDTANSHERIFLVEVMGRHAGWLAYQSGLAGGADAILIPERPFRLTNLVQQVLDREKHRKHSLIIVVSEDAWVELEDGSRLKFTPFMDERGEEKLAGMAERLAQLLREKTRAEIRTSVLGHLQRGGPPVAADRILATQMGAKAVRLAHQKQFGKVLVLRGIEIETLLLEEVAGKVKRIPSTLQL